MSLQSLAVLAEDLGYDSDLGWPVRIFEAEKEHPGMCAMMSIPTPTSSRIFKRLRSCRPNRIDQLS